MQIYGSIDGGVVPEYKISDSGVQFDLSPGQRVMNVVIDDPLEAFQIEILVDENGEGFLLRQGLVVSEDGSRYEAVPLEKPSEGVLKAEIRTNAQMLQVASRYPYGRDNLEKLICDTAGHESLRWRFVKRGFRGFPFAEFGDDDGRKRVHYLVGGEDAWETAGAWTVDSMVRELCENPSLEKELLKDSIVRLVPLPSPYSSTVDKPSYCTLGGEGIYGAATWGDDVPPPEFAGIRDMVEENISESRFGFLLTVHSWQAQRESSGLQTIRTAGDNALSEERTKWAREVMDTLIEGVPRGKTALPEKIWHPGLARDYLLAQHNLVTFRIEVTTVGMGIEGFRDTGRALIRNVARLEEPYS